MIEKRLMSYGGFVEEISGDGKAMGAYALRAPYPGKGPPWLYRPRKWEG